jgi:hypothetical protein
MLDRKGAADGGSYAAGMQAAHSGLNKSKPAEAPAEAPAGQPVVDDAVTIDDLPF